MGLGLIRRWSCTISQLGKLCAKGSLGHKARSSDRNNHDCHDPGDKDPGDALGGIPSSKFHERIITGHVSRSGYSYWRQAAFFQIPSAATTNPSGINQDASPKTSAGVDQLHSFRDEIARLHPRPKYLHQIRSDQNLPQAQHRCFAAQAEPRTDPEPSGRTHCRPTRSIRLPNRTGDLPVRCVEGPNVATPDNPDAGTVMDRCDNRSVLVNGNNPIREAIDDH